MVLEKIENINAYNCLYASVATLAKYYGREYQMISSGNWTMKYDIETKHKRIGDKIDVFSSFDVISRTKKFHGFYWEMELFYKHDINKDTGLFKQYTYPFFVSIDLYHMKWSNSYQKYHSLHYLIICDYDSKSETYRCVDPYFQYSFFEIKREDLFLSVDRCGRIICLELPTKIHPSDYINALKEDYSLLNQNDENYKNIKLFASDLYTSMDINYEFDVYKREPQMVPIMNKIRKIALCRSAYVCTLIYVYEKLKYDYLKESAELLNQSVLLWKTLKGKLLKTYITNSMDQNRESLVAMIEKIANIEREVLIILSTY